MDRQRYISTCNTRFPESCRVTFKLFSGFAKRQNIHRTWTLYVCIIIMIKAFNEKDVETVLYLNCRKMETSLGCWIATALSLLFPFIAATCILTFICSSPSFFTFLATDACTTCRNNKNLHPTPTMEKWEWIEQSYIFVFIMFSQNFTTHAWYSWIWFTHDLLTHLWMH